MKNVLVPYSGGLDSTYLIWKNLKEGNKVTVIYLEIENNYTKVELEKIHRTEIIKRFRNEFSYSQLEEKSYNYKIRVDYHSVGYSLIQVPIWILGMFLTLEPCYDEVQMGYVMNDDAISYLDEIRNLYEAHKIFVTDINQLEKFPKLTFPIIKMKKEEMIHALPKQYLELVYSCENPRIKSDNSSAIVEYSYCGNCVPCERYKRIGYAEEVFSPNYDRKYDKGKDEFSKVYNPHDSKDLMCLTPLEKPYIFPDSSTLHYPGEQLSLCFEESEIEGKIEEEKAEIDHGSLPSFNVVKG